MPEQICVTSCCNVSAHFEEFRVNRTAMDPPGVCYTLRRVLTAEDDCFSCVPPPIVRDLYNLDEFPPSFVDFPEEQNITVNCTDPPRLNLTATDNCTDPADLVITYNQTILEVTPTRRLLRRVYRVEDTCGLFEERVRFVTVALDAPICGNCAKDAWLTTFLTSADRHL